MFYTNQSVTSRLETSRYRDFSQFIESIGLGLENFGLEKKSQYRCRKYLVSKKVSVSVSKIFGLVKKPLYRSQKLRSQKKSRCRSQKILSQILRLKKVSVTT